MIDSRFERVMKKLALRTDGIRTKIAEDLKGAKPFDTEPITPQKQLEWFGENFTQENEAMFREQVGDEPVDDYIQKMDKLIQRGIG